MASLIALGLLAGQAVAFPWVSGVSGVDSTLLKRNAQLEARQAGGAVCSPQQVHHGAAG